MPNPNIRVDHPLLLKLAASPSDENILAVIREIKENYYSDACIAAQLAVILAQSGQLLTHEAEIIADVASTGGPSSLSTLLTPLFLQAGGALVPKLGVPGRPAGGIDSLAQIQGYRDNLSISEAGAIISTSGYAHFIAEGDAAPLDGRMFKIRQKVNSKAIPTLVTASLLAKKMAVGIRYAGLDIRVAPHGSFGIDWISAKENAKLFTKAAKILGIIAAPVLTDGRYPYQPYIGRSESIWAIFQTLNDKEDSWLAEHFEVCRVLAQAALPLSVRKLVAAATRNDLHKKLKLNLHAQGASISAYLDLVESTKLKHTINITSKRDGWINYSLVDIKKLIIECGKKAHTTQPYPDAAGIRLLKRQGTWIFKGDIIATLRIEGCDAEEAILRFEKILQPTDTCEASLYYFDYE